jgi:Tol biopolymer transport system component
MTRSQCIKRVLGAVTLSLVSLTAAACGIQHRTEASFTSPSGVIAVSGGALSGKQSVMLISLDSRKVQRVHTPDVAIGYALSPDGHQMAVAGDQGIWIMQSDGSQPQLILNYESNAQGFGEMSWSPDGKNLVLARSDGSLMTLSIDGSNLQRIINNADQPTWAANGNIVFTRNPNQSSRLGTPAEVSRDGGDLRDLHHQGDWAEPRLSPDGSTIALENERGIFLFPINGGKSQVVTSSGHYPVWSPDGRYLAFVRETHCPSGQGVCMSRVFVVPTSGGRARPYGPAVSDMGYLSWAR